MTALDMLDILVHVVFVAIGVLALADFLRHRDAARRDVALLFSILAVPFLLQLIAMIQGVPVSDGAGAVSILALVLEPYLLLRLVRYLRYMPARMLPLALYGMIATIIVGMVFGSRAPIISTLVSQTYLIGINLYAAVGFVRGVLRSSGVARQRLRFAAGGSGLFALIFVAVLLANSIPQEKDVLLLLAETLAIVCVVAFYIGFAPPRWLRRIWQLAETEDYLGQIRRKPANADVDTADIMPDLCRVASQAVGGMAAGIVRKDAETQRWTLAYADDLSKIPWNDATLAGLELEVSAPKYLRDSKHLSEGERRLLETVSANTLLMTPITTSEGTWGLLLVFLRYGSLFIDDDLHFVTLLTEQSAIVLENIELIAHLREHAQSLEERTARLTAVNGELESFSYSVSHDLRAPLRAVDGFSQALLEDYNDVLDEIGKDFLHRIRTESQRMGQLIDDLIGLSRFTRTEMNLAGVDLSRIAQEIAADLHAKEPDRAVELSIQSGIQACGDARLIRVALQNLIGNAWKFTAKKPGARIEFGCREAAGATEYYVRDNGAGFDMAYANKLFGAFQRLHAMEDFAGTGIGLATVQRIMHRHGGSIRAEAAVNQGATFYFTLGPQNCA